jgi:hypothetical protein
MPSVEEGPVTVEASEGRLYDLGRRFGRCESFVDGVDEAIDACLCVGREDDGLLRHTRLSNL